MVNPRLINLAEKLGNDVLPKQEAVNPLTDPAIRPRVSNSGEYIVLENIVCTDSNGKPFEQYPQLFVRKDIERGADQNQITHTPYDWIPYFDDKGMFLPSFALSCNIVEALYSKRSDPEINKVLLQYKDHGSGYGWHAQNTVVDWGANKIIHYPSKQTNGGNINAGRSTKELSFRKINFSNTFLQDALKKKDFKDYIQNLTGLTKPETLVEIGKYFGNPAKVWVSSSDEMRAAWLGCDDYSFDLDTGSDLNFDNAARGVRVQRR